MKILNCIPTLTPAHGEMCTTCTARLAVPSNHHTDYNIVMYRALLNFLYSLESKPLYFPVICKVLKKMQYTNGSVVFTLLCEWEFFHHLTCFWHDVCSVSA